MIDLRTSTLKQIVTEDYRAAAVFEKYSLDFCCKGGKTLGEACSEKSIAVDYVLNELTAAIEMAEPAAAAFSAMPLDELIDYIVSRHHSYVREALPVLSAHTAKVASVHGANHPEVIEIARRFAMVAEELQHHILKEERILFPFIKYLVDAAERGDSMSLPPFGSARNPIRMMEAEHESAGNEMYEIRALSNLYSPPADACTTFRVTYQELEEFEKNLHQHVHLENNILFPKAIELETKMLTQKN